MHIPLWSRLGLTLCLWSLTSTALAQSWSTERQLAYQGRLERDGRALTGAVDVRVELWDDPADTGPAHRLWWDELIAVPVREGAFALVLGSDAHPLSDAVFQTEPLYLAMQVRSTGGASYTALANRQRLSAVPFAARAATARDLITINLDGRGTSRFVDVQASGSTNLNSLSVSGATSLNGTTALNGITTLNGATLTAPLVGTGTPREVRVQDDLRVDGKLHAVGGLFGAYQEVVMGAPSAGVSTTGAQTAASDLLVIAYVWSDHNGDRCWSQIKLTPPGQSEFAAAAASCHYYTTSDTFVHNASFTVPVPKGYQWRVDVTDTAGTCLKKVHTVSVAN